MDAQAPPSLGHVDHPGHEIRDLLDQRGELIDDDYQARWSLGRGHVEHFGEVLGPSLQYRHPAPELGAQGHQGSPRQPLVEVGDRSHRVGQRRQGRA